MARKSSRRSFIASRALRRMAVPLVGLLVVLAFSANHLAAASAAGTDPTVVQVPPNAASAVDPCGPSNATWDLPPYADTDQFDFAIDADGSASVTDITGYEVFPGGTNYYNYGVAPDANVACPSPTVVQPPMNPDSVNDPCGPNNASWVMPAYADTDRFNFYFSDDDHLMVMDENYDEVFPNGTIYYDYGLAPDSNQPCDFTIIDVPPQPSVADPCNPQGVTSNATWNVPADDSTFSWVVGDGTDVPLGDLEVAIIPTEVAFPDHTTYHEYGVAPDSGVACIPATPTAPSQSTPSCADPLKTVTPPNQPGVVWLVNGQPTGVTNLSPGASEAYIASEAPGYEFTAGSQTNFLYANVFDPSTCQAPTPPPTTTPTTSGPSPACVAARGRSAAAKAKLAMLKKHHAPRLKLVKAKKTLAAALHAQNAVCG